MLRPDQLTRLNDLAEKLADVFLEEGDPDNWSGAGKLPVDMTTVERGNRHWDRKGAAGTAGVLRYTLDLTNYHKDTPPADPNKETDLDDKIKDAERRASKAVERVLAKAKVKA